MKKIMVGGILVSFLYAGGWDHPVQGIRGLGMGDAYTALSEDASSIWWNPGGLCFQKNLLEIQIGGTYDMPMHKVEFTLIDKTAESNLKTFVPQAFLSYKFQKFALGFGYYVEYGGGGVDWKKEDVGADIYSALGVMAFSPTFSYMINEKIGIGGKLELLYGKYNDERKIETMETKSEGSGWAFTGGAGILFKPIDILSIGFNLRGPFKFKGTGTATTHITSPIDTTMKFDTESECDFPITIGFGIGIKPIPNFIGAIDFEYTTWSSLDYFITTVKRPEGEDVDTTEFLFENAFKIKTGVEYTLPMGLSLRTGFAYDKAASPDSTLSLQNIDVDKFVIFGGIGYDIANFGIDLAILKAFGSEREYKEIKYNMNPFVLGIALKYKL